MISMKCVYVRTDLYMKLHTELDRLWAKIHKIIADVIKFRLDIRKTFQNELNVRAYENAVGKQKKAFENIHTA